MLSPRLDSLGVRPLEPEDAEELHALLEANRSHLARWLPWAAGQERDGTERFLAEAEGQFARDDGFQARIAPEGEIIGVVGFHARIAPEGEIIGVVGFHAIDWVNRSTSLGYWLGADAQGKGTMTTVVKSLCDHVFYEWELHRLEIHCAPENLRSRAIPERLGFREEARLRETELIGDRYLDSVVYGMLEDEWGSTPT
jgi:ribosomal-protein-serine acetyltransferase